MLFIVHHDILYMYSMNIKVTVFKSIVKYLDIDSIIQNPW